MKNLYVKLGRQGIRKNKNMYMPFLLTCIGMVIMYYIINYVAVSDVVLSFRGAGLAGSLFVLGGRLIAIFSIMFLFYSSSFLMRRRRHEFGLFNILGLEKKDIAKVLSVELLMTLGISLGVGLIFGIAFSKLAEMTLIKLVKADLVYGFKIPLNIVIKTIVVYALIFLLLYLNALRQLKKYNSIQLMKSENLGEKPPKGNLLLGIIGLLMLLCAYFVAVTSADPYKTLERFFVAVIIVIVSTYMIFISGSVALCKLLQKSRGYYKLKNFIAVSSMSFRMKRNGASLASICILSTMVLVMIAATSCFYFGIEDILNTSYSNDVVYTLNYKVCDGINEDELKVFDEIIKEYADKNGLEMNNVRRSVSSSTFGYLLDGKFLTDHVYNEVMEKPDMPPCFIRVVSLEDFNKSEGLSEMLSDDEIFLLGNNLVKELKFFEVSDGIRYRVKTPEVQVDLDDIKFFTGNFKTLAVIDDCRALIVVKDFEKFNGDLDKSFSEEEKYKFKINVSQGFDLTGDTEAKHGFTDYVRSSVDKTLIEEVTMSSYSFNSVFEERDYWYSFIGGMFFLGIILSIVFMIAMILMIYYKQISEGYEDVERFDIMQKIGMGTDDIRRSINAQIVTVFLLPLVFAVMHLAFAFPMIKNIILLAGLNNIALFIKTTAVSTLLFAIFYMIVYKMTSRVYFLIVRRKQTN